MFKFSCCWHFNGHLQVQIAGEFAKHCHLKTRLHVFNNEISLVIAAQRDLSAVLIKLAGKKCRREFTRLRPWISRILIIYDMWYHRDIIRDMLFTFELRMENHLHLHLSRFLEYSLMKAGDLLWQVGGKLVTFWLFSCKSNIFKEEKTAVFKSYLAASRMQAKNCLKVSSTN